MKNFPELQTALNAFDATEQVAGYHSFTNVPIVSRFLKERRESNRIYFIGNGGSAAIASHMAEDWLKAGNFASMCFNDGAQLTCLANDLGFEKVFSVPLAAHGRSGDILIAISSSGNSRNIHQAVVVAKAKCMTVITLSGFKPDNPLRKMGDINFYVPSEKYGVVEVAHLAILHAILDEIVEQDQKKTVITHAVHNGVVDSTAVWNGE